MKLALAAAIISFVCGAVSAQEMGTIDLTVAPKRIGDRNKTGLLAGCKEILPGAIADGVVVNSDGHRPEISLEIVNLSSDKPTVGSELQARVRLTNSGERPIEIPWSTKPSAAIDGQDPRALQWEEGSFELFVRGQGDHDVLLKSLSYPLYGSKFSPGTLLTIKRGEWVVAVTKFRFEAEYKVSAEGWKEGEKQLTAQWTQASRSGAKCSGASGYFRHDYDEKSLPLPIRLVLQKEPTVGNATNPD
jgi:hypothetical protein